MDRELTFYGLYVYSKYIWWQEMPPHQPHVTITFLWVGIFIRGLQRNSGEAWLKEGGEDIFFTSLQQIILSGGGGGGMKNRRTLALYTYVCYVWLLCCNFMGAGWPADDIGCLQNIARSSIRITSIGFICRCVLTLLNNCTVQVNQYLVTQPWFVYHLISYKNYSSKSYLIFR